MARVPSPKVQCSLGCFDRKTRTFVELGGREMACQEESDDEESER